MLEFPRSPVSPAEFFEGYVAGLFADIDLPASLASADVAMGIRLEGEGGGEWVAALRRGALALRPEPRAHTAATWIQSVEDWRGALWEGRGGVVGERAAVLFRPGVPAVAAARLAAPSPESIDRLAALGGVLSARVTGEPAGDWSLAVKFGPGDIPEEPTATVSVHHEDAAALSRGELAPLDAFLAGRISVSGDVLLLMQLQEWLTGVRAAGGPRA